MCGVRTGTPHIYYFNRIDLKKIDRTGSKIRLRRNSVPVRKTGKTQSCLATD